MFIYFYFLRCLHYSRPTPGPLNCLPGDGHLLGLGESEATGGGQVAVMTTDVGVSLGISPAQASVGLLRYERGEGSLGQFALFVEGVETQPASLGSLRQRGVAVGGHDVPGLQELPCNNNS